MESLTTSDHEALRTLIDAHAHIYGPSSHQHDPKGSSAPVLQFESSEVHTIVFPHLTTPEVLSAFPPQPAVVVNVTEHSGNYDEVLALATLIASQNRPFGNSRTVVCLGLHPCHLSELIHRAAVAMTDLDSVVKDVVAAHVARIRTLVDRDRRSGANHIVGIGEIGLDFSPHVISPPAGNQSSETTAAIPETFKRLQIDAFRALITLARDLNLIVNVHSRCAGHHALGVLAEENYLQMALMHNFDGRAKYAVEAAAAGTVFSVAPIIARDDQLAKLAKTLPMHSLLIESDSPCLAAIKGTRNTPQQIHIACETIARIRGSTVTAVAQTTSANARRFFNDFEPRGAND